MEEAKDAAGDVVGNVFEGMGGVGDAIGGALGSAGAALKEEFSPSAEPGAENEEVTQESGLSRLCGAVFCCLIIAPMLIIAGSVTAGVNEKNYLCTDRAISEGFDKVNTAGCDSANEGQGSLIIFSCNLDPKSGESFKPWPQEAHTHLGTGLYTEVEMFQCVEKATTTKSKTTAGGKKTSTTTYNYSKQWMSSRVDSGSFSKKDTQEFKTGCGAGVENPSWPEELPKSGTVRAKSAKVGAYTIGPDFISDIKLTKPLTNFTPPAGWAQSGDRYTTSKYRLGGAPAVAAAPAPAPSAGNETTAAPGTAAPSASSGGEQIGDVRVSFKSDDTDSLTYTVLGQNAGGDAGIRRWTASDSWGCSGFTLGSMKQGTWTMEEFQKALESSNNAILYILRFLAFALIWFGLSRCAGPCEVLGECVPFIGPYIGDAIEVIACIVTCCPALVCCFGVASIVYIALRPMLGIPMMLLFFISAGAFGFWKYKKEQKKKLEGGAPTVAPPVRPMDTE